MNEDNINNPLIKDIFEDDTTECDDVDDRYCESDLGSIDTLLSNAVTEKKLNKSLTIIDKSLTSVKSSGHFLTKLNPTIERNLTSSGKFSYLNTVKPGEKYSKEWCTINKKYTIISGENMMCCFNAIIKAFRLCIRPNVFKKFLLYHFNKNVDKFSVKYPYVDLETLHCILSNDRELGDTNVLALVSFLFNVSFAIILSHTQYYIVGEGDDYNVSK